MTHGERRLLLAVADALLATADNPLAPIDAARLREARRLVAEERLRGVIQSCPVVPSRGARLAGGIT